MVFPSDGAASTSPPTHQVATAGEALIDLIEGADGLLRPCPGGAVYNLTRALGLQGVRTLYLNPLSGDSMGRRLAQGLHDAGVTLAAPQPVREPSSLAIAALDAQGKARYSFYRDGVADRQVSAATLIGDCAGAPGLQVVATGCLALSEQDAHAYLPWLAQQRADGRLVAVDANLRLSAAKDPGAYRANVVKALQQADLVKVSDDDLSDLGLSEGDPLAQARHLLQVTPARLIALTLGASGAWLVPREGPALHAMEAAPVDVADTVGAGDCFFAGLITALLAGPGPVEPLSTERLQGVLHHALASASLCVERTGCEPPTYAAAAARAQASRWAGTRG